MVDYGSAELRFQLWDPGSALEFEEMPRDVTPAFLAALASQQVRPAIFVEAHFVSGPVYLWTGLGSIVWNGHTWLGVGSLGSISTIEEGSAVEAKGITLTLSGVDASLLNLVTGEFQQGLPVTVSLGLFDDAGQLIPNPVLSFAGRTDQPRIEVSGDTATISIACENLLIDLNTSIERRYTNEDQQSEFPGDRGFEFVPSIQQRTIHWGQSASSTNNG